MKFNSKFVTFILSLMKKHVLFFLSLCFVMLTCQKDEDPYIKIIQNDITINDGGGAQTISFETNVNWVAKTSANWCTVSPASGDASMKNTTVTLTANDTYDTRSCTVTIMAGSMSETITINQASNLGLLVTKDRYELSNDGGAIGVEVKANIDFKVEILDDWITQIDTRGLSTTNLKFEVAKNVSYDNREGRIVIKQQGGGLSSTIKVYQSQQDAIILSNKSLDISNKQQTLEVELKTNVDFEVIIPNEAKGWVSHASTRALRSETVLLDIAANKAYDNRSTEVYVKNRTTSLQDTLTINQEANMGLIVTQDKYELSNEASTIEVEVKANVEYDVEVSDNWITRIETRGLTSTILNFGIAKNSSYDNREGTITISHKNGDLSSVIKVYQSQQDAIILSNKTYEISSEHHSLEVELRTNVDVEVIIPEGARSWVSYISTRALRTETLLLDVAKNEDKNNTRTTQVYVRNKVTTLQDTLTIIQEEAPDLPTLTTLEAYDVLMSSAKIGGVILSDGGAPIVEKGVCWGRDKNPMVEDSKVESEVEGDEFEVEITRLDAETEYYARAYATNRAGTAYGDEVMFRTTSIVATPVVRPSGGIYTTAQNVTITSATEGAEIRYTLDGSDPVETSELYSGAIAVDGEVTVKAKAFKTNWVASPMVKETYTIALGAQLIEGVGNSVQHIDVAGDFILSFENLDNKDVFFVFSNENERSEVDMPRLQSSVQTVSSTVKSSSGAPDAAPFHVSGIPSVTEFNNNPVVKPEDGMSKAQYQQYLASRPEKLSVGSKDYLNDDSGNAELSTVRKVISAHGKNLYIWVADNCWYDGGIKSYNVTQEMVDALAYKFLSQGYDNDIYEWVTNIAGEPWGPTGSSWYIPETDDIHIWLMDIYNDNKTTGTVTLGYFYARDNYLKSVLSDSNEKLLFTIDAVLFAKPDYNGAWDVSHYWPNKLISTLAHEFTHMIYFYQKTILSNQYANTAINEMCAQCVEDLVANKIHSDGPRGVPYQTPSAGYRGNYSGRLPLYNTHNEYNLLVWYLHPSHTLLNYSKTYALGAYLMRNYGGAKLIRELVQNRYTGTASIVDAVNSNGGAVSSYGEILQKFGAANLLSDRTDMTTGYRYNSSGWSKSTVNGITYDLGAINLYNYTPTPNIYYQLPTTQEAGSNVFYRAGGNLSGKNEWYFKGLSEDTKVTVVVK